MRRSVLNTVMALACSMFVSGFVALVSPDPGRAADRSNEAGEQWKKRCELINETREHTGERKNDCEQRRQALFPPQAPGKRPQGMNALTVKPESARPFTEQDVAEYFRTHNLPMNFGSPNDFEVESLEFLTSREVSQRLAGASPGLADNEFVGFATLTGAFAFSGPPGVSAAEFSPAYAAFDAKTGNLLMIGTLEQEAPPRPR